AHRRSLASARSEFVDLRAGLWDDPASYGIRPAQPEPPPYVTASTKRYSPHPLVPPGREGFCLPENPEKPNHERNPDGQGADLRHDTPGRRAVARHLA